MAFRNRTCFPEGFSDAFGIPDRILRPFHWTARRIDADDSVWPNTDVPQLSSDGTRFANLSQKVLTLLSRTHGGTAIRRRPYWSHQRSDHKLSFRDTICEPFEFVVIGIDAYVRIE